MKKLAFVMAAVIITGSLSGCFNGEKASLMEEISRLQNELDSQNGSSEVRDSDIDTVRDSDVSDNADADNGSSVNDFESFVSKGLISTNVGAITDCAESISGSLVIPDYISKIDSYAFAMCDKLNSVSIPGSVDTIGICAFQNCFELAGVSMADGVEVIGESAFTQCKKLTDLKISSSVRTIYNGAFYMCGFTSIDLPNIHYIGDHAFSHCTELKEVNIGDGISSIGKGAFDECTSLTKLTYKGKTYSYADIDDFYNAVNDPDSVSSVNNSDGNYIYFGDDGVLYWEADPNADTYFVKADDGTHSFSDLCLSNNSVNYAYLVREEGFPTGWCTLNVYGVKENGEEFYIASIEYYNTADDSGSAASGDISSSGIYFDESGTLRWKMYADADTYVVRADNGSHHAEDICYSNDSGNYAYYMSTVDFPIGWCTLKVYGVKESGEEFYIGSIDYYYNG